MSIRFPQSIKCVSAPREEVSRTEIFVQLRFRYSTLINGFALIEWIITYRRTNTLSAPSQVVSKLVIEAQ